MKTDGDIRQVVGAWLRSAIEDAERRGMPELKPLLESLAESTVALRKADWNEHVSPAAGAGTPQEPGVDR